MTTRRILVLAIISTLGATLAVPGCSFFRQPTPNNSCILDEDCFRGVGEVCDTELNRCVNGLDAAPLPDAPPPVRDATPAPDAGMIDGGAVDAGGVDA